MAERVLLPVIYRDVLKLIRLPQKKSASIKGLCDSQLTLGLHQTSPVWICYSTVNICRQRKRRRRRKGVKPGRERPMKDQVLWGEGRKMKKRRRRTKKAFHTEHCHSFPGHLHCTPRLTCDLFQMRKDDCSKCEVTPVNAQARFPWHTRVKNMNNLQINNYLQYRLIWALLSLWIVLSVKHQIIVKHAHHSFPKLLQMSAWSEPREIQFAVTHNREKQ